MFEPGEPYLVIDADLLPPDSVIYDDEPPGHVSILGVDWEIVYKAVIDRRKMPE